MSKKFAFFIQPQLKKSDIIYRIIIAQSPTPQQINQMPGVFLYPRKYGSYKESLDSFEQIKKWKLPNFSDDIIHCSITKLHNVNLKFPPPPQDILDFALRNLGNLTFQKLRQSYKKVKDHEKYCHQLTIEDQKGEKMQSAKLKMVRSCLTNLKRLKKLKKISLTCIYLQDSAILNFLQGKFENLQKLNLSQNFLTHQAVKILSLCSFNHLTHLEIGQNKIGSKGLVYFSLIKWPSLTHANLAGIHCTPEGIESFSRHYNRNLQQLLLNSNICNENSLRSLLRSKPLKIEVTKCSNPQRYFVQRVNYLRRLDWRCDQLLFMSEVSKLKSISEQYSSKPTRKLLANMYQRRNSYVISKHYK